MPSSTIREAKEQKVNEIKELLQSAKALVLVDYQGLNVAQDTELRNAFRASGVKYSVYKNRLLKIAFNDLGYTQFDEALNGTTSIAVSLNDLSSPSKIVTEKATAYKKLKIKCGLADGKFLSEADCKVIAKLPSKEVLIAQLLGMLQAPIASFARAIDAIAKQKQA